MSLMDTISITIDGHGEFRVTPNQMDRSIARYLPDSPFGLRVKIDAHDRNQFPSGHYSDLLTVTECLIVLAELDGPAPY